MGWIILGVLMAVSLLVMRFLGMRGSMLMAAGAALFLGCAGYAMQGRPATPGAPAGGDGGSQVLPLTGARHAFYGNFSPEEHWLRLSEGLARAGNTGDAVGILQNAVRRYPHIPHLWVGLGNALVDHARGLTPPAEFAYAQASQLQPEHPAPAFFRGLALARSGDSRGAIAEWRTLLSQAPANASWRPLVEQGIDALSQSRRPR